MGVPDPGTLFAPSADALERCRLACERLDHLRNHDDRDGLDEFADEIKQAVASLKSLAWEAIRVGRFNMTNQKLSNQKINCEFL